MMKKQTKQESFNFEDFEKEAVRRLLDGEELTGKDGVMTPLVKKILERALEAELAQHEGSRFWLQVLSDLTNRGVKDILIASIDNLTGFSEAIKTIFPKTEVQLCIVHQIRNSLRYVASKDYKTFLKDLKKVYQASSKKVAEHNLNELEEKWGKKYPIVFKSWRTNWDDLTQYFKYPSEIRRIIYTTNTVEGFHRQLRKVTKTKGAFSSENALLKLIYLASMKAMEKWSLPAWGWKITLQKLLILFEDRIDPELITDTV